jgi:hypothetical protein
MNNRIFSASASIILLATCLMLGLWISLVPLVIIVVVLWLIALRRILGFRLAVPVSFLFALWFLAALDYLIAARLLEALSANLLLWGVLGIGAVALNVWRQEEKRSWSWADVATWGAPLLGTLAWLSVFAVNGMGGSSVGLAWAMSGDAATFVTQARDIVILGGSEIWNNAVPLAAVLAALAMLSGRDASGLTPALEGDVQGFALAWALCIAASCWIFGAIVVALLREKHVSPWIVIVAGAISSLAPLTWLYAGYAIFFGFFNSTVAVVVASLTMFAFLVGRRRPAVLLGVLFVSSTLTFLAWSPLVVIPLGLALLVVILKAREILGTRGIDLGILLFGFVQLLAFGVWQAVPFFIATQGPPVEGGKSLLASSGAAIYFRPGYLAVVFAGVVLVTALAYVRSNRYVFWGVLTATLSIAAGFAYMVRGSGQFDFPWLYYPSKFIWIGLLVMLPLGLGAALAWALSRTKRAITAVLILTLFAVGGFYFFTKSSTLGNINAGISTPTAFNELLDNREDIQIDRLPGRDVAATVFGLEDQQKLNILWQSGSKHEDQINFWLLKMWSTSAHGNLMLGDFIYGLKERNMTNLCELLVDVKTPVTILTASSALAGEVAKECAGIPVSVVMSPQ